MDIRKIISVLLNKNLQAAHMTIHEIATALWDIARHKPISVYGALTQARLFEDIKVCLLFIGLRRSGKTLAASLLDAHPNIIIADESGVLRYIHARFSEKQIYYLLLNNSRSFSKAGRISAGHSHAIPSQWQGKFHKKLIVIGDNHGHGAALRLGARPWLLDRLHNTMRVKIKFLHVVRNPYDNISSISKRIHKNLPDSIAYYFYLCETVAKVLRQINQDELFELRHESLLADPQNSIKKICGFLGLAEPDVDYLEDCASIVAPSLPKTRYHIQWDDTLIDMVRERLSEFLFLQGYSYDD